MGPVDQRGKPIDIGDTVLQFHRAYYGVAITEGTVLKIDSYALKSGKKKFALTVDCVSAKGKPTVRVMKQYGTLVVVDRSVEKKVAIAAENVANRQLMASQLDQMLQLVP